eukprot:CAMPEP_0115077506 /NCGR_PEP_ID=MMETSP0227-20121206/17028_1 /TAXON_ID=89957 /ORGANISM="Polarella glacialis, Strain CCMP 1383" /LENGTH=30 /DNA_ID= /DNA_START= /DNA_END= /DNA_ORIENTATION=
MECGRCNSLKRIKLLPPGMARSAMSALGNP